LERPIPISEQHLETTRADLQQVGLAIAIKICHGQRRSSYRSAARESSVAISQAEIPGRGQDAGFAVKIGHEYGPGSDGPRWRRGKGNLAPRDRHQGAEYYKRNKKVY
jgi:hypothetical protein